MKNFFLNDPNLLVYGFAMVFFASFGQTFYIALFNDDIRNLYKITDGEFGLVYAIATLVSSFLFINYFFRNVFIFSQSRILPGFWQPN